MIVEQLVATLGIQVDTASIAKADAALKAFTSGVTSWLVGVGATVAAVSAAVVRTAHLGDNVGEMAEKLQVGTTELQRLQYAANLSDTPVESLNLGLKSLSVAAYEASQGSAEAASKFAKLGVSIYGQNGKLKTADVLLGDVSDKISAMPQGMAKLGAASDLFGSRAGKEMIPLLNQGSAAIRELGDEAQRTGAIMGEDVIRASDRFDKATKRAGAALGAIMTRLSGPLIDKFATMIENLAKNIGPLTKTLGPLFSAVGMLVDAFAWLLGNETRIRVLLATVSIALGTWALKAVLASLAMHSLSLASVQAAVASAAAWLSAIAPLAAIAAFLYLLIDDLYVFSKGGKSAMGDLLSWTNKFNPDGNPLVEMLKAGIALVTDLTDPKRWRNFAAALTNFQAEVWSVIGDIVNHGIDLIEESLFNFLDGLAEKFPFLAKVVGTVQSGISGAEKLRGRAAEGLMSTADGVAGGIGSIIGSGARETNQFNADLMNGGFKLLDNVASWNKRPVQTGVSPSRQHLGPVKKESVINLYFSGQYQPEQISYEIKKAQDRANQDALEDLR